MLQGLLDRTRDPQKIAKLEAELAGSPLPEAGEHIWRSFLRLHQRRGSNGFGPLPLRWTEFDAFSRMSGLRLQPWEIEVIEQLDVVALAPPAPSDDSESNE